eukprot:CAMPEP_0194272410 /NCGR_PEP_ID=MMETSP0169-20130528/5991_1 /TAXON_ID=218684 /ORGANISM="Corethron pennatum, Strain L29A3" /LENGTH=324 /DNA_ID=CAMNT_0039015069 /DNA_START=98 /DNA_END=1072 /DNA_ORIENTATION=-
MDVEYQSGGAGETDKKEDKKNGRIVKLHPLAIMTICDHYTRVSSGGSTLPRDSIVVGILFGTRDSLACADSIVDAVEIEFETGKGVSPTIVASSIKMKIELHAEVFPLQEAVGWYRVGDAVEASDLTVQSQITAHVADPLFVLIRTEPEDGAKEVPVSLYEAVGGAFVPMEFELEASESERIAIEHVAKARRPANAAGTDDGGGALKEQLQSVASSIDSMRVRVDALVDYLWMVEAKEVQPDQRLLRQAVALVKILPAIPSAEGGTVLSEEFRREFDDTLAISYLSTIAKTAVSLRTYSEKSKLMNEASSGTNLTSTRIRRGLH